MKKGSVNALLPVGTGSKDTKVISNKLLIAFLYDIKSIVPDSDNIPTWWLKLQLIEMLSLSYLQAVKVFNYMLSKGFILLSEGGSHE